MAVAGNGLILAAIWRNPSLRNPSYVLLAGLAKTDFCTGLLTQPFFTLYKLGEITGNRKLFCIGGLVTESAALYFSSLTFVVITMIAVERWLHMTRRTLLTARRVVVLYMTFVVLLLAVVTGRMHMWYYPSEAFSVVAVLFLVVAALCVILTAFAYFQVFHIIRRHQNQIRTNNSAIDMKKYKESISTILYIFTIFIFSYIPYICCATVLHILQDFGKSSVAALNACAAVVFSSSSFNPLLYYWRIKEIRDSVKNIIRKLFSRRQNGGQS